MVSFVKAAWLPTWLGASLFAAQAASLAQAPRTDPANSQAAVPPLAYRSPFSEYKALAAPEVTPWRAANDLVLQRGGWRAYAREASAPGAASATPPALPAASQPGAMPMPGHKMP